MENELADEECGHLSRILLAAPQVSQRQQFFSWVHGPVQSLIPHEILLCGIRRDDGVLLHQRFSACRYFRDAHFALATQPQNLIDQLAVFWGQNGKPVMLAPGLGDSWHAPLLSLELKNVAFHGMDWLNGPIKGYASFCRVRAPFDAKLALYVEILLPHLLAALARVLTQEMREGGPVNDCVAVVTSREIEVLQWVRKGKTNDEIARILGLSMLTVKNHLHKIMKKMDARTRGQAVAKAIALGLMPAWEMAD